MRFINSFVFIFYVFCLASVYATDCEVNVWEGWGSCRGSCKRATQVRNRSVLRPILPSDIEFLSNPCPHLYEIRSCKLERCAFNRTAVVADPEPDVLCDLTTWDTWGPCEGRCPSGWQVRNRAVVQPFVPAVGPFRNPCPHLYEVRACDMLSCVGIHETGALLAHTTDRSNLVNPPGFGDGLSASVVTTNQDYVDETTHTNAVEATTENADVPLEDSATISIVNASATFAANEVTPTATQPSISDNWKAVVLAQTDTPQNLIDIMARNLKAPADQHTPAWANAIFGAQPVFAPEQRPLGPSFDATVTAPQLPTRATASQIPFPAPNGIMESNSQEDIIECHVTQWQEWSQCKEPCATAWQVRNRDVLKPPLTSEGILINLCPHLYQVRICTLEDCIQAAKKNESSQQRKQEEFTPDNQERIFKLLNSSNSSLEVPLTVLFQKKDKKTQQPLEPSFAAVVPPGEAPVSNFSILQTQFPPDMNSAERVLIATDSEDILEQSLIEGSGVLQPVFNSSTTFMDSINGTLWRNGTLLREGNETTTRTTVRHRSTTSPQNENLSTMATEFTTTVQYEYEETETQTTDHSTPNFIALNSLRRAELQAPRVMVEKCKKYATDEPCVNGEKPQLVIRWYRHPDFVECSTYLYPYCGVEQEEIDEPMKFEEDCYISCYTEEEKRTMPIFRNLKFKDGFRCD